MNDKRSYTEYTVTTATTDFVIGFDDYDEGGKDNILVTLNGVLAESQGYAVMRKNAQVVTITPAVQSGTVRLTRVTDIDESFHQFTAGALFSAKSVDENFQQVRHSQQEVRDGFVFLEYNTNGIVQASKEATAQAKAATVEATASAVRAESAADTAVQAVGSLQGVVDAATTATTNADKATATATTAASQATTATTSAQNAAQAAIVAKQEAATATAAASAAAVDTLAATARAIEAAELAENTDVAQLQLDLESQKLDTGITATPKYTGAVNRTVAEKLSDSMSIEDFKSVNDSDYTQAFLRARDALAANGGGVLNLFAGKTYSISQKIIFNSSNTTINGNGATVIWNGTAGGTLYDGVFEFMGTPTVNTTTVAETALINSTAVKVMSVTGFSANDYVLFKSTTATVKPHRFINQLFRIAAIDVPSKTLLLDTSLGLDYDISTYPINVTKVDTVHNSHVLNVDFEALGQTSRGVGISAVQMQYTSACTVHIKAKGFWFKGVSWHYSNGAITSVTASEPASVTGGEGYGIQFAYSTNCMAVNSFGYGLRHLADATASFGVTFENMFDSASQSSAFNLHSMGEHNVVMNNCHSIGSIQYGFGIGSYGVGVIGHWSGYITLHNCTSKDSVSVAVKAVGAQGNYTFNNCDFSTKTGNNEAYSMYVTNADVTITNCKLASGLYVLIDTVTKNDGFVRVNGGSINRNKGFTKTLQMGEGTRLVISNCELDNYWELLGACDLRIDGNSHIKAVSDHFVPSGLKTHNISIANSTITLDGNQNTSYIIYGNVISFSNVEFIATKNIGLKIYSVNTIVNNCRGTLRLQSYATAILSYSLNVFRCIGYDNVLIVYNTTGTLSIKGNSLTSDATNTVSMNTSNTPSVLQYIDNVITGNVSISMTPPKGIFTGNVTVGTATYPTATANVIVKDNI